MAELKVWLDGRIVDDKDAKVSIMVHSLQYGSGIFEGIRAYDAGGVPAVFRLEEHVKRFMNTARIYHMDLGFSPDVIAEAIKDVITANSLKSCYIRPFAFYNDSNIGVSPFGKKVSVFIAARPFGLYFSNADKGLKCKVSSWHRIDSSVLPVQAKASGNYLNSVIAMWDAHESGFDEAILTTRDGYLTEGPGENLFLVKDGELLTPGRESQILMGITRDSILQFAGSIGIRASERLIRREELYTADELFFAGTAAEITPIVNVDGIEVSGGTIGPVTRKIREKFRAIVEGRDASYSKWLTRVKA
ncbi:MAG: branched-chain amino acid transaminase [Thermoplasmataceae archaeon]|jgi:branched-chain amino acid aminotransferase